MSETSSVPPLALRLGPESQIPDHPGSMWDVPRRSNGYGKSGGNQPQPQTPGLTPGGGFQYPGPPEDYFSPHHHHGDHHDGYEYDRGHGQQQQHLKTGVLPPGSAVDASQLLTQCRYILSEYQGLLRRRKASATSVADLDARLRGQQMAVLHSLGELQIEVHSMLKEAQNHRWRKWLLGGAIASFIPLVRRIFRRGNDHETDQQSGQVQSSNDTEYAFRRASRIVSYLKESVLGKGSWAKMAMFVFAVLYVFQNEVTLRVAKTLQKRLRRLTARIEEGAYADIDERDLKVLQGWRWRVLLW
ncbi:hypothetical protein GMORB2_4273 [Geosmithia morbida]|uniref:Uncharacterized protein n=1 Tax=Geosmithia morbida TaxID=1094350 RepID=A0A9P5D2T4_9HYPO|nr:uncharacterized protein GMORB2_4273 [Geosmithia morbida]KAF4125433.1 hypothetical protein GMORB2_4273 [Geosmithia morbida]